MQKTVKVLEGLKHEMTVIIPNNAVKKTYKKHLKSLAKQIKMRGFRPGRVPFEVIEQKYRSSLNSEVAHDLMKTSLVDALEQDKLKIAGEPSLHPDAFNKEASFRYVAQFEVYPEIHLKDFSDVKFDRWTAEVTDNDLKKVLEKIQHEHAQWKSVDRPAKQGDRLLIDFSGTIDKQAFEGGTAKNFSVELGSQKMIPGFESGLIGFKSDQIGTIFVNFPKDYSSVHLAGQKAEFSVTVHKIEEAELPALDDSFAESLNIKGGINQLKDQVRLEMEERIKKMSAAHIKKQALDKLLALNPIQVPEVFIEMEMQALQRSKKIGKGSESQSPTHSPYLEQAKKRVVLGLLISELMQQYDIKVSTAQVHARVKELASRYPNPEAVIKSYLNNKQLLSEVEAIIVEDEVIQKLLEKAVFEEKKLTYDQIMEFNE